MNKNDKLLERLRDDLEWAEIFQYEIPVTLPDPPGGEENA